MPSAEKSAQSRAGRPWQLRLFDKTLKKRQKLALLRRQLGPLDDRRCLLVTNGDNNGALNWHFRRLGGRWRWVENEADGIAQMEALLGEPVAHGRADRIPADDETFDVAISIDVHEHLDDPQAFTRELARVTRPGGTVIVTTPDGGERRAITRLKDLLGMTREVYGHRVVGYTIEQHRSMLEAAGVRPTDAGSYARPITELIELAINLAYVKLLARRSGAKRDPGVIAPSTGDDVRKLERQYRIYAAIYPLLRAVASLDVLFTPMTGYAVSVVGRRDG